MLLFNYDTEGFFTRIREARVDPKNNENFLIPANATTVSFESSDVPEKHVPMFAEDKWIFVEDNRGTITYSKESGEPFVCDYIGKIDDKFTTIKKPNESYYVWDEKNGWIVDVDKMKAFQRIIRNNKLNASDFTQLADAPFTDEVKALWKTYRKDLRDFFNEWTIEKEFPIEPGA